MTGSTPFSRHFGDNHGLQCGFCTPGMILTAVEILNRNPEATGAEVRHGLEGNICRLYRLREHRQVGGGGRRAWIELGGAGTLSPEDREENDGPLRRSFHKAAGRSPLHSGAGALRRQPPASGHGARCHQAQPLRPRPDHRDGHFGGERHGGSVGRIHRPGFQGRGLRLPAVRLAGAGYPRFPTGRSW